MASHRLLTAARLIVEWRIKGYIVRAEGGQLDVAGPISSDEEAQIRALKAELVELLTIEVPGTDLVPVSPPESQSVPEPSSPPPPKPKLPRGPTSESGIPLMTDDLFRWRAARDSAILRGQRFDEPCPRYSYGNDDE
jgi:hypothetical protein